jgi:hypothetical protein
MTDDSTLIFMLESIEENLAEGMLHTVVLALNLPFGMLRNRKGGQQIFVISSKPASDSED